MQKAENEIIARLTKKNDTCIFCGGVLFLCARIVALLCRYLEAVVRDPSQRRTRAIGWSAASLEQKNAGIGCFSVDAAK